MACCTMLRSDCDCAKCFYHYIFNGGCVIRPKMSSSYNLGSNPQYRKFLTITSKAILTMLYKRGTCIPFNEGIKEG